MTTHQITTCDITQYSSGMIGAMSTLCPVCNSPVVDTIGVDGLGGIYHPSCVSALRELAPAAADLVWRPIMGEAKRRRIFEARLKAKYDQEPLSATPPAITLTNGRKITICADSIGDNICFEEPPRRAID